MKTLVKLALKQFNWQKTAGVLLALIVLLSFVSLDLQAKDDIFLIHKKKEAASVDVAAKIAAVTKVCEEAGGEFRPLPLSGNLCLCGDKPFNPKIINCDENQEMFWIGPEIFTLGPIEIKDAKVKLVDYQAVKDGTVIEIDGKKYALVKIKRYNWKIGEVGLGSKSRRVSSEQLVVCPLDASKEENALSCYMKNDQELGEMVKAFASLLVDDIRSSFYVK